VKIKSTAVNHLDLVEASGIIYIAVLPQRSPSGFARASNQLSDDTATTFLKGSSRWLPSGALNAFGFLEQVSEGYRVVPPLPEHTD